MLQSLLILGRQPELGLAELESLFSPDLITPIESAAFLQVAPEEIPFQRLGGSIKLCELVAIYDTTDFSKLQFRLTKEKSLYAPLTDSKKLTLGLSAYNFSISKEKLFATGLTIKKILRTPDRPVRLVPLADGTTLNSAQVLHNGLTSKNGLEIVLIRDGVRTLICRTVAEQDIEDYTNRDRERPKRDTRVGMLPPKLAQIIINLAAGTVVKQTPATSNSGETEALASSPGVELTLLDPFCGTGVILQEAALIGFNVYGTDLDERMVHYSQDNINWLQETRHIQLKSHIEAGDATTHQWVQPIDLVASETYLGQPMQDFPTSEKLNEIRTTCNLIVEKFLRNIAGQLKRGTRLCLAVPAWQKSAGNFVRLPTLDHLDRLGYNQLDFKHVRSNDLIYARADQIVARELLVLTRQ